MMITTFRYDGILVREEVEKTPDLEQLRKVINCSWVERIQVKGRSFWFDEEGKLRNPDSVNLEATMFAHNMDAGLFPGDYIVGTAVLVGTTSSIEKYLDQRYGSGRTRPVLH